MCKSADSCAKTSRDCSFNGSEEVLCFHFPESPRPKDESNRDIHSFQMDKKWMRDGIDSCSCCARYHLHRCCAGCMQPPPTYQPIVPQEIEPERLQKLMEMVAKVKSACQCCIKDSTAKECCGLCYVYFPNLKNENL